MVYLLVAFIFLQMLDIISTQRALARGGYEKNPFMKKVVGSPPLFVLVKFISTGIVTYLALIDDTAVMTAVLFGFDLFYIRIVVNNFRIK